MKNFLQKIKEKAKKNPKKIAFPDFAERRVAAAMAIIKRQGLAIPVKPVIDPKKYAARFAALRGCTLAEAEKKLRDRYCYATMMLEAGDVDGVICGPLGSSRERILPALEILKLHRISGFFFMVLPKTVTKDAANGGVLLFADCAVNIDPSAQELADIAIDSAKTAAKFGLKPKVAMLSFSTAGSSQNEHAKKMREAARIAKKKNSRLKIEGEMQVDAALIDSVGKSKSPGSQIAGRANVLIFPNLEAGNIGYKLVERLANAKAVGPILQGLAKPLNEVSRGCDVEDIVNVAAITSMC
ncbi:phosphate acetyltransferase [Candidatus Peregrinibacteria bacterium]|nr:phosphate acetyltransferase [Candidatus Peregrinibacteria bacterium]